jgi:plasmid stability protein
MSGVATLNIRNVPEEVVKTLKARAARKGDSLNEEVVRALSDAVARRTVEDVLESIDRIQATMRRRPTTADELVEGIHQARDERTEQILRAALRPRDDA